MQKVFDEKYIKQATKTDRKRLQDKRRDSIEWRNTKERFSGVM